MHGQVMLLLGNTTLSEHQPEHVLLTGLGRLGHNERVVERWRLWQSDSQGAFRQGEISGRFAKVGARRCFNTVALCRRTSSS